jgi:Protein of unknown function (DUF3054)
VQRKTAVFVATDAVALVLFAVIGLASHHKGFGFHAIVRDVVPVVLGWFLAAAIVGTYRRPSWPAFVVAWLVGVSAGVFVRGLVLHRHVLGGRYLTFLAVTLAVTFVLMVALRGVVTVLTRSDALRRIAAPSGQRGRR